MTKLVHWSTQGEDIHTNSKIRVENLLTKSDATKIIYIKITFGLIARE